MFSEKSRVKMNTKRQQVEIVNFWKVSNKHLNISYIKVEITKKMREYLN